MVDVNNSIWATVMLGTVATVVFIWHSYLTRNRDTPYVAEELAGSASPLQSWSI